jgi:hypothetical protein
VKAASSTIRDAEDSCGLRDRPDVVGGNRFERDAISLAFFVG